MRSKILDLMENLFTDEEKWDISLLSSIYNYSCKQAIDWYLGSIKSRSHSVANHFLLLWKLTEDLNFLVTFYRKSFLATSETWVVQVLNFQNSQYFQSQRKYRKFSSETSIVLGNTDLTPKAQDIITLVTERIWWLDRSFINTKKLCTHAHQHVLPQT